MYKFSEKTAQTILTKMLKAAAKSGRTLLGYSWIDGPLQCCCDRFRAFRFKDMIIPGLPDLPNGQKIPIDLNGIYGKIDLLNYERLSVPSDDELEALAADDRAHKIRGGFNDNEGRKRGYYFFGEGKPVVNLDFLRDALKVFPEADIFYNPENLAAPLLFSCSRGDSILLPVRWNIDAHAAKRPWAPLKKAGKRLPTFSLNQFAARFAPAA